MQELRTEHRSEMQELRTELNSFKEETNTRFDTLETKVDSISDKLDDVEANNADRHVTIEGEVRGIKKSLSRIEIVTADNWGDIARLRARKRIK
jgi:SMC interacting uncharacterized protein involved in chromosome segregation